MIGWVKNAVGKAWEQVTSHDWLVLIVIVVMAMILGWLLSRGNKKRR
jgi:TRAP-type C4-dicarboxylate transport system permease large subunit